MVTLPATACIDLALGSIESCEVAFEADGRGGSARLGAESFDLLIAATGSTNLDGIELAASRLDRTMPRCPPSWWPTPRLLPARPRASRGRRRLFGPRTGSGGTGRQRRSSAAPPPRRRRARTAAQTGRTPYVFDNIIGTCPPMRKVFETIERVADSGVDVLIIGETGTGKELVARSIHRRSRRAEKPFVPVDCGAIPENLLESEFFGHERGAFTGADNRTIGLLEFADGGTFFLDELGELPRCCKPSCCGLCRSAKFAASAAARRSRSTSDRGRDGPRPGRDDPPEALSPRPVLPDQRGADRSASVARSAATTWVCWPNTSPRVTAVRWAALWPALRPRPIR